LLGNWGERDAKEKEESAVRGDREEKKGKEKS